MALSFVDLSWNSGYAIDPGGRYSCERFDAHKDPDRFIKVTVGYTMVSEDGLGLDTFIKQNKIGKWIMFQGEGKTREKRPYFGGSANCSSISNCVQGNNLLPGKKAKSKPLLLNSPSQIP